MANEKRIKTVCVKCKEKFRFFAEEKGALVLYCPFCETPLKINFDERDEKDIYRSCLID